LVGIATGAIALAAAGTAEVVSFGALTIPASVVAAAGYVELSLALAATAKGGYDLWAATQDIKQYSYNAYDIFKLMKASPYNRTQSLQWWRVYH
jgi:hypothetical protein